MTTLPSPRIIPLSPGPENQIDGAWPDRVLKTVSRAELHVYAVENPVGRVLVCAGGGYLALMLDREGDDVARWLNTLGYEACVLVHRLPGAEQVGARSVQLQNELAGLVYGVHHVRKHHQPGRDTARLALQALNAELRAGRDAGQILGKYLGRDAQLAEVNNPK